MRMRLNIKERFEIVIPSLSLVVRGKTKQRERGLNIMNNLDTLLWAADQVVAEFDEFGETLQVGEDDDFGQYGPTSAIEQLRQAVKNVTKQQDP